MTVVEQITAFERTQGLKEENVEKIERKEDNNDNLFLKSGDLNEKNLIEEEYTSIEKNINAARKVLSAN